MPYDLYGTYYASRIDAENAEMAQMAQIDADIAMRKVQEARDDQAREEHNIWQYIHMLEERIVNLEAKLNQQTK